ncbi:polyprenyl diphosphate synthase [Campylobacter showae]|uniref:polyprenyl diphosphate synthase n=1 Tax=Campylobacter showae TaxID=204 RepID=UPI0028D5294E|nr:polyprenyl diphosphate synthase [Campylobacter showae]
MNELNHLAIIMDGNGRWAKRRGLLRTKGHETGANVVGQMCEFCIDEGVAVLSLYAFSTENWKRPKSEVAFLMELLHKFLLSKRDSFIKNGIKFNVIGDEGPLSDKLKNEIADIKNATTQNSRLKLNLALNYGAKDEILRAFRRFCEKKGGEFNAQNLTLNLSEDSLQACLDEPAPIDLLVRTGGEQRLSNFMLWQASYAEFAFTPTLWPDFTREELALITAKFKKKDRRFGGL